MKRFKLIAISLLIFLLLLNSPPFKWVIGARDCNYSNYEGSFTFEQINNKGRDFENCIYNFTEYKRRNNTDTILYRTCPKSWWKVWNYSDYVFQPQWKLPYMSWKEIEKRRGQVENKTGFQDF